ncbi:hypothetical protein BDF21DRAFT_493548 [Thamnidium elegans]|nr:hypothetical protein BDF21DRAFT_493548 [Thamnidium elegans]
MESKAGLRINVVPLPLFCSYNNFVEGLSESAFTRIASNQRTNNIFRQGGTFEALLNYKWKTFAKRKFAMICFIHALYYVSYCTGVLFSRVLYVKGPENELDMKHPGHLASLAIMGLSLSILIIQEFRQFLNTMNKMSYLASGYNWVDIAAFGFPIFTVFQSLLEWDHFAEVCSITTLILWSHSILRLRAIPSFGVTLDIIIQLFRNVFATIFIMFLVIIAFTMSFVVLLLSKENEYFQDNFEGSFTSGTITAHGLINTANVSTDNGFRNWFKAFSKAWLFIYGVWDPVTEGDVGDNMMVMALCILFSFVTMFIFSNMIVALMSNPIEEVRRNGKKAWISHFAAVISEIEILWCSDAEKRSRINNPVYIYYKSEQETNIAHRKNLLKETEDLNEKLGITNEKNMDV